MKESILICDDDINILDVLSSYFEKENFEVYTANNGRDGLIIFMENRPSIVILDLMMPGMSGEELCGKIRGISDTPIIMLTAKIEEDNILEGFELGADDYVTKPFSPRQVVARVKAILKRTKKNESDNILLSYDGNISLNKDSKTLNVRGEERRVTLIEYKLLCSFLENQNKVYTRDELMDIAMGIEVDRYDRVIDTHIKNLRKKIECDNKHPKYIRTVHGIGYKFGGEL
ncbi:response regulator transcription factor [Oceanirhabdus sp. W0125-5]|uniref:response regulator transcription factor n=1 Tax=Oceanirhabdus sp. W0125-5 TaxID=2999116 RepID=UPI0022F309FF|nr:response regulator transcription factor [Oceanirhabdus sp. W0125-5]WBW98317.1 response regulator transcription factor [Oceanirhabdus sp. W0125-5]